MPSTRCKIRTQTNKTGIETHLTPTGYDASNHVVATETGTDAGYNSVTAEGHLAVELHQLLHDRDRSVPASP